MARAFDLYVDGLDQRQYAEQFGGDPPDDDGDAPDSDIPDSDLDDEPDSDHGDPDDGVPW